MPSYSTIDRPITETRDSVNGYDNNRALPDSFDVEPESTPPRTISPYQTEVVDTAHNSVSLVKQDDANDDISSVDSFDLQADSPEPPATEDHIASLRSQQADADVSSQVFDEIGLALARRRRVPVPHAACVCGPTFPTEDVLLGVVNDRTMRVVPITTVEQWKQHVNRPVLTVYRDPSGSSATNSSNGMLRLAVCRGVARRVVNADVPRVKYMNYAQRTRLIDTFPRFDTTEPLNLNLVNNQHYANLKCPSIFDGQHLHAIVE